MAPRATWDPRAVDATEALRGTAAAASVASSLGLDTEDAVVLNDSNRLVLRLLPCDVVARVSPIGWFSAAREVEVVAHLAATQAPVAGLHPDVPPRVVERDGFEISLWVHIASAPPGDLPPARYADALHRLHGALRVTRVAAPHCTDRFAAVQRWLTDGAATPDLPPADRDLLVERLAAPMRRTDGPTVEQLLHGEPHPWNVLAAEDGPVFVDFENCARGPVEADLAWVPRAVTAHYEEVDDDLLEDCRGAVLALVAAHRWRQDDRHPSGRESGVAFLDAVRSGPPWPTLDEITWPTHPVSPRV